MCTRVQFSVFAVVSFTVLLPIGIVTIVNGYLPARRLADVRLISGE